MMASVWGAPVQEQRQHVVFFDQLARVFGSELGVELVVQRDQFDLLAVDAALGVDHVNVELRSIRGSFTPQPPPVKPAVCPTSNWAWAAPAWRRGAAAIQHFFKACMVCLSW